MAKRQTSSTRQSGRLARRTNRTTTQGSGRGRNPKPIEDYLEEDDYGEDGEGREQMYENLKQDVKRFPVPPDMRGRRGEYYDQVYSGNYTDSNQRATREYRATSLDNIIDRYVDARTDLIEALENDELA